jgi:hypothetical protein
VEELIVILHEQGLIKVVDHEAHVWALQLPMSWSCSWSIKTTMTIS